MAYVSQLKKKSPVRKTCMESKKFVLPLDKLTYYTTFHYTVLKILYKDMHPKEENKHKKFHPQKKKKTKIRFHFLILPKSQIQ